MSERSEIIEGMAHRLWTGAAELRPRAVGYKDLPPGAKKAADDLATLYENMNDSSLQALLDEYSPGDDTHRFGSWIARAALEPKVDDDLLESRRRRRSSARYEAETAGMAVPYFTIELDARSNELAWNGSADAEAVGLGHRTRVNPRDWDRDGARGYGRYAYRMGRMLSQALADARKEGVPERLMGDVQDGWAAERAELAENPKRTKIQDYTMHDRSELEGKPSHSFESAPHTKSLAEVRQLLARRRQKCHRDCPGWAVFETVRGDEIQVCDECNTLQPKAVRLSDDDVAQLPEAQKALREVVAEDLEENPRSTFFFRVAEHGDINVREVDRALSRYGNFVDASGRVNRGNIEAIAMANGYAGDVQVIDYIERRARARAHQLPGRPPGVPNGRRR